MATWLFQEERMVVLRIRYRVQAETEDDAFERVQDQCGEFSVWQACTAEAERRGCELHGMLTLDDSVQLELIADLLESLSQREV